MIVPHALIAALIVAFKNVKCRKSKLSPEESVAKVRNIVLQGEREEVKEQAEDAEEVEEAEDAEDAKGTEKVEKEEVKNEEKEVKIEEKEVERVEELSPLSQPLPRKKH